MNLAKLSRLQRFILHTAYRNRLAEDGLTAKGKPRVDLYYHEVLAGYFEFPVAHYASNLREHPGSHRFDREAIGQARYNAAQASLSRAARRLEDRGLINRYNAAASWWAGLRLTDSAITALSKAEHELASVVGADPRA